MYSFQCSGRSSPGVHTNALTSAAIYIYNLSFKECLIKCRADPGCKSAHYYTHYAAGFNYGYYCLMMRGWGLPNYPTAATVPTSTGNLGSVTNANFCEYQGEALQNDLLYILLSY